MSLVEKRYAEALLDIAIKHGTVEVYKNQLSTISAAFTENTELWKVLNDPEYNIDFISEVLTGIFKDHVDKQILAFLLLLAENGRISAFEGIVNVFKDLANRYSELLTVEITSAFELDKSQIAEIEEKYKKLYESSAVKSIVNIDPKLIGGVIIKVGDMVFDHSLTKRLEGILKNL